jgi:three-Cys-motif partner protein
MVKSYHRFGGTWTEDKLERNSRYLQAYTMALKNQPFRLMYVDAFAGTGYRASKKFGETVRGFFPLPQTTGLARGSVRRALEIEPSFDEYVFIEANAGRFHELGKVEDEYPGQRARIDFRNEEANSAIIQLCRRTNWRQTRAVMFLDPYGMQVDWRTIEEVARTRHIDMWYLFPVGAVHRLLPREGRASPVWASALDRILGDSGWRTVFYETARDSTLFGEIDRKSKIADVSVIEEYVRDRLTKVFSGGVAAKALQLRNSKDSCMFLLFFACWNPNPKAHRLALRIAEHVLKAA